MNKREREIKNKREIENCIKKKSNEKEKSDKG
jgi:hypothetical protein